MYKNRSKLHYAAYILIIAFFVSFMPNFGTIAGSLTAIIAAELWLKSKNDKPLIFILIGLFLLIGGIIVQL